VKKVYVNVTTRLIIQMDESETVEEVIENMDYNFIASNSTEATIIDTEIVDFEVTDSK